MKITSLISASAMALALAAPVYAQTAPATPVPTTAAPTTPAPTGIPAAFTNVPAVQQVDAQLAAQGYTITDVVQNTNGSYSILSKSPAGQLRLITVNPATGGVSDTVTAGVTAGTNGAPMVNAEGTFEHEANENEAVDGMENDDDGGRDRDSNDDRNDSGDDHNGDDSDGSDD